MKAIVQRRYGPPDAPGVLDLQEVDPPKIKEDQVLVRVRAASVNPADWYGVVGRPVLVRLAGGLRRPRHPLPGIDMAGVVEAVGGKVTRFRPGDEVFGTGGGSGTYAEYVNTGENRVVAKPANVTFEQAAAVPVAALTALQGLHRGGIRPGHKVLINGASGGVGTFAVQIARSFGAEVTAVCSTRNVAAVRSLGADRVIDYTREDFVADGQRYDLLFDVIGTRSLADRRRALRPQGALVVVGGPKGGRVLGPARTLLKVVLTPRFGGQKLIAFISRSSREDLDRLRELLATGKVTPVVERTYPLPDVPEALRYLGEGHARAKIVITV